MRRIGIGICVALILAGCASLALGVSLWLSGKGGTEATYDHERLGVLLDALQDPDPAVWQPAVEEIDATLAAYHFAEIRTPADVQRASDRKQLDADPLPLLLVADSTNQLIHDKVAVWMLQLEAVPDVARRALAGRSQPAVRRIAYDILARRGGWAMEDQSRLVDAAAGEPDLLCRGAALQALASLLSVDLSGLEPQDRADVPAALRNSVPQIRAVAQALVAGLGEAGRPLLGPERDTLIRLLVSDANGRGADAPPRRLLDLLTPEVVPLLLDIVDHEERPDASVCALLAHGADTEASEAQLLGALASAGKFLHLAILETLGVRRPPSPEGMRALLAGLGGADPTERGVAAKALERIGPDLRLLPDLLDLLGHSAADVREHAGRLLDSLTRRNDRLGLMVWKSSAGGLPEVLDVAEGPVGGVPRIHDLASRASKDLAAVAAAGAGPGTATAIRLFRGLEPTPERRALVAGFATSASPDLREAALATLAHWEPTGPAEPDVLEIPRNGSREGLKTAEPSVLEPHWHGLLEGLAAAEPVTRRAAARSLRRLVGPGGSVRSQRRYQGTEAALVAAVRDPDREIAVAAVECLGSILATEAQPVLWKLLEGKDPVLRAAAARSLWWKGVRGTDIAAVLVEALTVADPSCRADAAAALIEFRRGLSIILTSETWQHSPRTPNPEASIARLRAATRHPEPDVRAAAKGIIEEIDDYKKRRDDW